MAICLPGGNGTIVEAKSAMCAIRDNRGFNREDMKWIGIGVEFCVIISLFAYGGYWLDRWMGNENPEFLIAGFFVGFFLMIYWIIKSTKDLRK